MAPVRRMQENQCRPKAQLTRGHAAVLDDMGDVASAHTWAGLLQSYLARSFSKSDAHCKSDVQKFNTRTSTEPEQLKAYRPSLKLRRQSLPKRLQCQNLSYKLAKRIDV